MTETESVKIQPTWLDRVTGFVSPRWQLQRTRARVATTLLLRHYDGASTGRRTQGWRKTGGDANVTIGAALAPLRIAARDLVRNNPFAESALSTIVDQVVGWGIVPKVPKGARGSKFWEAWRRWSETTACDADGRDNFYGLEALALRTIVESGEVLVRRRFRRPDDGLPIPIQLQVLDPDFLDTAKDLTILPGGGRIIQGVEFDAIGRRVAYWLFPEHPGSNLASSSSVRVPADNVLHLFRRVRPGQVRGPSWFAPVVVKFKDFDEFDDATLMKQKIAACLAVLTSDTDGTANPLGPTTTAADTIDSLEPGMIMNVAPGRSIEVVQPPAARDYEPYAKTQLRAIATGLGVKYEDLTGDYADMPFSAARMSFLRHESRVQQWRWRLIIPQFCEPVWNWAMQAAAIMNLVEGEPPAALWTPPPIPMIDPEKEGLAEQRNIRNGIKTWPEAIRERGFDPDEQLEEMAETLKKFDQLGLKLDCDPRNMTQAGQQQATAGAPAPATTEAEDDEA